MQHNNHLTFQIIEVSVFSSKGHIADMTINEDSLDLLVAQVKRLGGWVTVGR